MPPQVLVLEPRSALLPWPQPLKRQQLRRLPRRERLPARALLQQLALLPSREEAQLLRAVQAWLAAWVL
ncbi:hypothetical protein DYQ48_00425 [Xanthomonas hortorum]|nr:hypothetical protein BI317_00710 [Xanthomonas hortorum pv. gardneri]QEW13722.1 hypothetical protein DYQ48_00425 [Xanthomonas hortorum]